MSSFIGHALAGATIHFSGQRNNGPAARWSLPVLIILAVAPDLDYLPLWLWGMDCNPRLSHSLACCLLLSVVAWLICKPLYTRGGMRPPGLLAMSLATSSHLLLDLAVGVHGLPILWPLPLAEISSPLALLPSAGQLRLDNFYLWRNLLIETGVLLPISALCLAWARKVSWRLIARTAAWLAPLWVFFVTWSIRIH